MIWSGYTECALFIFEISKLEIATCEKHPREAGGICIDLETLGTHLWADYKSLDQYTKANTIKMTARWKKKINEKKSKTKVYAYPLREAALIYLKLNHLVFGDFFHVPCLGCKFWRVRKPFLVVIATAL